MEGAFSPSTLVQTIYTHEAASRGVVDEALPATGFRMDAGGYLKVTLMLGVLSATAAVNMVLQHADWDANNDPPEAGDFADALDDDGNVITFPATVPVANDQKCYILQVNGNRLKPWVRVRLVQAVASQTFLGAVLAEIFYVKHSELSDANIPLTAGTLNKANRATNQSGGVILSVPA